MLEIKDLHAFYGKAEVLFGISMKVHQGEPVGVIGPNGAGKSTLFKSILKMVEWQGKIIFNGVDLSALSTMDIVKKGICYVPEGRKIFPFMSVKENLLIGAYNNIDAVEETLDKVYEIFPILKERAKQKAKTLSGGEQQMLAIARGIMSCPEILMLDEPSLGLAPYLVLTLFDVIRRLRNEGVTMVLVEQNTQLSLAISDYAYVLSGGRVEIEGEAREVMKIESVKKAYLGM